MVRTTISLEAKDKRWLDRAARLEGVPMTALIRRAVRLLREQSRRERPNLDDLLDATSGSWRLGDGLAYQKKVRRGITGDGSPLVLRRRALRSERGDRAL